MNLYVGNLTYETSETDIQAAFASFGQVTEVRLIRDRDTGRSKGFAFVEMPSRQEAEAAMQGLNGKPVQGRPLTVNEAKPRSTSGIASGRNGRGSRGW